MVVNNSDQPSGAAKPTTVKAIPTSPVMASFDIVEVEGKQVIVGQVGFIDQFGMERIAKTGTDLGVMNLGKHVLAIFQGLVDIIEPDEETKKQLAERQNAEILAEKTRILNAYNNKSTDERPS